MGDKKYCGVDLYLGGDLVLRSLTLIGERVYGHPRFGLVSVIELSCRPGECDVVIEAVLHDMRITGWVEYDLRYPSGRDRFLGLCDRIERRGSERIIYLLKRQPHITARARGTR